MPRRAPFVPLSCCRCELSSVTSFSRDFGGGRAGKGEEKARRGNGGGDALTSTSRSLDQEGYWTGRGSSLSSCPRLPHPTSRLREVLEVGQDCEAVDSLAKTACSPLIDIYSKRHGEYIPRWRRGASILADPVAVLLSPSFPHQPSPPPNLCLLLRYQLPTRLSNHVYDEPRPLADHPVLGRQHPPSTP